MRCGRCDRVFNALLALAEDLDQEEPGLAATGTTTMPALEDEPEEEGLIEVEELPAEENSGRSICGRTAGRRFDTGQHQADRAANMDLDVVERQSTGTFETIVLEGDGFLQTEEHVDEQEVDAQLQELARQMDTPEPEPSCGRHRAGDRGGGAGTGWPTKPWAIVAGITGCGGATAAVLALALGGQLLHHSRQALVSHPWLGARSSRCMPCLA